MNSAIKGPRMANSNHAVGKPVLLTLTSAVGSRADRISPGRELLPPVLVACFVEAAD
jgi:hypothetical protein